MGSRRPYTSALTAYARQLEEQSQQDEWRSQKTLDPTAFNAGAEKHFIEWLTRKLKYSRAKAVPTSWVIGNGAMEVGVSVLTIKRYLQKLCSESGPFKSNGPQIRLRKPPTKPKSRGQIAPVTEK